MQSVSRLRFVRPPEQEVNCQNTVKTSIPFICAVSRTKSLTFTTFWANLADDKLMIVFLFSPRNQDLTFLPNCLHWKQFTWNVKSCFLWKKQNKNKKKKKKKTKNKKKNTFICRQLKSLPRVLSDNLQIGMACTAFDLRILYLPVVHLSATCVTMFVSLIL